MILTRTNKCILVISHQRSGTHFTIDSIRNNIKGTVFHSLRMGANPGPDHLLLGHDREFFDLLHSYIFREDDKIPILKSHLLPEEFAAAIRTEVFPPYVRSLIEHIFKNSLKVYIRRDCRDVLVSYYYYTKNGGGLFVGTKDRNQMATFSEFIRMPNEYIMPVRHFKSYDQNRVRYWLYHVQQWCSFSGIIKITYEDLYNNWKETIKVLAHQLGLQLYSEHELERPVVKKKNFVEKAISKLFDKVGLNYLRTNSAVLPRKGIIGDWKKHFSEQDMDFVRKEIGEQAKHIGYNFLETDFEVL